MSQLCLRWEERRSKFRPANPIRTTEYEVAAIDGDAIAKAFVRQHHYSASYPPARFRFGLYRHAALVGVAVFAPPAQLEGGQLELGRFVLLDEVPGNGETWFLARAFEQLRRLGVERVVSFSDPMPRTRLDGTVVFPGHVGTIYQAFNAVHVGRGDKRTHRMFPDGTLFAPRAMQKIRARERGVAYAAGLLERWGASPLQAGEDSRAWLRRWSPALTRPLRHPGNLKYEWALTRRARRDLPAGLSYPKAATHIGSARP